MTNNKGQAMTRKRLDTLKAINRASDDHANVWADDVASDLGITVSAATCRLRALVKSGLIKVQNITCRTSKTKYQKASYYLTAAGRDAIEPVTIQAAEVAELIGLLKARGQNDRARLVYNSYVTANGINSHSYHIRWRALRRLGWIMHGNEIVREVSA